MSVPVIIEKKNGSFRANAVGISEVFAEAATAEQALAAVTELLRKRVATGQLAFVDIERMGISGLAGIFRDDPSLLEICEEAYRQRDAERDAEFGPTKSRKSKAKTTHQNRRKSSARTAKPKKININHGASNPRNQPK